MATRIASGRTTQGSTAWQQFVSSEGALNGVFVDVDTSAAKLAGTPVYVTSLGGRSHHWSTTGATSIYLPTNTGFRVHVRWSDGSSLNPATANSLDWHINWIAMEI